MAQLTIDLVVLDGQTPDDVARLVAGKWADEVSWEFGESGNCWPEVTYTGTEGVLDSIKQRYDNLGDDA